VTTPCAYAGAYAEKCEPYEVAKAGERFKTTGSGVDDTTGEEPPNKTDGVDEYAKPASDTAAPDNRGDGVEDPIKSAGEEEAKAPSKAGAGVEDPMKDAGEDDTKAPSKDWAAAALE
jgi:hypothetical protein